MSRQLTFANVRAARRSARRAVAGPGRRAFARGKARDAAQRAAAATTPQREAALRAIESLLARFITELGVGMEFQSCDFTDWMIERGERPAPESIDGRALGGVIPRFVEKRVIAKVGYRMNGGSRFTNAGSTPRAVWRIERLPARCGFKVPPPLGSAA